MNYNLNAPNALYPHVISGFARDRLRFKLSLEPIASK
jgi:hypothetical protein